MMRLEKVGLPRVLCFVVAASMPPLWYEIAVLHYRGSFQSRFMWLPIVYLPAEMVAGLMAGAVDRRGTRRMFRTLSCGVAVLGAFGTLMHIRGVRRQMGGFYNWRYNLMTGPPVIAPPQVALLGLVGVLATRGDNTRELVHRLRMIEIPAQLMLAIEAGSSHYQNYFANRVQYVPIILAPALAAALAMAEVPIRPLRRIGQRLELALSATATIAGLIGLGFHAYNIRKRSGGFSWQNLFFGAPLVAPLQLTGQGLLGLLAGYFDRDHR